MENAVNYSPDQEILGYASSSFTNEYRIELLNSLSLLYSFEFPDIQETLCNLLNDPSAEDEETLRSSFVNLIKLSLSDLLQFHQVSVREDTELDVMNAIMSALVMVQDTEDVIPYLRLLESDKENEEKLAAIVEEFTPISSIKVLEAVFEVGDNLLDNLYTVLGKKEMLQEDGLSSTNEKLVDNLKDFIVYAGKEQLAYELSSHGFKVGFPTATYYPYASSFVDTGDNKTTAVNLLGYFFMAEDTYDRPIESYRAISEQLIHDTKRILPIESEMRRVMEEFEQYKKALKEAKP